LRIGKLVGRPRTAAGPVWPARDRPRGIACTLAAVLLTGLALQFVGPIGAAWASHSSTHFVVSQSGSNYVAQSSTKTYTGGLKTVVESAVYNDLKPAGGGTVTFQAGVFDLGTTYFRLEEVSDIVFEGQGMNATTIQNNTGTVSSDTEPFNFKGAYRVTIRDLAVSAGGNPRTTSDAIDFDKGNDSLVQRVKITYSRGKGIIFDGKDAGWTSQGNTVLDCEIYGTNNDGIQFLASTNNRVEGCYIHDTVKDGIEATKSQSNAPQPHKKSNDNVIVGNIIDNAGQNGVRIHSSDRNQITGNQITNSADDTANQDGIRIICDESITGDDNRVEGNSATDNQATKTQAYGLNINNSICNRTFVGTNNFAGNKTGTIRDLGTNTQYGTSDTTPPSTPTNLQANAVSSSRVDLTWTASTDNVGVVAYDIYRNASFLTSVGAVTTHSDTTVSPNTTYSYQVRARDSAGNPSGLSNIDTVTTPTGPPPPTVLTFTPTDDATVAADQATTPLGGQQLIGVDSSPVKHALLKFNVTGITGTVTSAKLRLACINSSDSGGLLYRVLDPNSWSEGSVTWNSSPAADTTQVASLGAVSANQAYEVNVTSLVAGNGLVSIKMISNSGTGNGADYYSKEGSIAPQLIVTVSGGGSDTTPPSDPTNLQATAVSSNRVDLTWTASTDNVGVTAYDIYRNASFLTSVGAVTTHSDTTVSPNTTYSYQVRARDAAGNPSGLSNTDTVTTPAAADTTPPSDPTNLQATAVSSNRVDLTWTASTDNVGVTAYDIYRNASFLTSVGAVTTHSDTTVSPNATYSYQVRARDAAGNPSGLSNTDTVTTPAAGAALFSDGFETGNFSNWTTNTGLVAQQQEKFAGSWGARGTTTSAATWAYKTLGTTYTELHYRIRFKVISQGSTSTVNLLKLRTATGTAIFGLFRASNGNLGYRNEVAAVSTTSSTPVTTGAWHEVQVRVRINGASGESETWLDGVRIATLSKSENFGTTPLGRVQIGENSSGKTYDVAFDDVVANTSFVS
jgi:parallel beta-helix repeat protein